MLIVNCGPDRTVKLDMVINATFLVKVLHNPFPQVASSSYTSAQITFLMDVILPMEKTMPPIL